MTLMNNMEVSIVGKGPSLDRISVADIRFGASRQQPSVYIAIKIAIYFGAKKLILLCFDACMSGNLMQAGRK